MPTTLSPTRLAETDLAPSQTRITSARTPTQADDHRALANPHELAHGNTPAEDHIVANSDMTAEYRVVGEHHFVADMTIMPNVAPYHEKQPSPTCVFPPPSSVPVLMVTFSRISQSAPTSGVVGPPR